MGSTPVVVISSNSVIQGLIITGGLFGVIAESNSTIQGNVISANTAAGIVLGGSANVVVGNYIGTDPSGRQALGLQVVGIDVLGSGNVIGDDTPAGRNVISGNFVGVGVRNVLPSVPQGNRIVAGLVALQCRR